MDETVMVSPDPKDGVTHRCQREGCANAAKKKFCSSACRQAAYRNSEAHMAILASDRQWRIRRRKQYYGIKYQSKTLTPYFTPSGPSSRDLGRLGDFWVKVIDGGQGNRKRKRLNLHQDSPVKP